MNPTSDRPNIHIPLTNLDRIVEIIGWCVLVAVWYLTISHYSTLPDTIPIHFNAAGKADGFGGKISILLLPGISTILFIGLTALNRRPQVFNYPTEITVDNAAPQYTNAMRLIRYLKTIIVIIFGLIDYKTIQNANGKADGLGAWFLPLTLVAIFLPILLYVVPMLKSNK